MWSPEQRASWAQRWLWEDPSGIRDSHTAGHPLQVCLSTSPKDDWDSSLPVLTPRQAGAPGINVMR